MLLSANKAESEAAKWRLDEYVLYIIIFFTQKKQQFRKHLIIVMWICLYQLCSSVLQ